MGAMGWTNTTLELKSAFSFMLSMKKVYKGTHKVAFSELDDAFGGFFQKVSGKFFFFQGLV